MPQISSGKGPLDQQIPLPLHPKSSGFKSNRNSNYPQQMQPAEAAVKWNMQSQRSNQSKIKPDMEGEGVYAEHYPRQQAQILSAGGIKPQYSNNQNDQLIEQNPTNI